MLPDPKKLFLSEIDHATGRRPKYKVHTSLGHAKNALNGRTRTEFGSGIPYKRYVQPGRIFQQVDGEWALLYDISEEVLEEDLPWK